MGVGIIVNTESGHGEQLGRMDEIILLQYIRLLLVRTTLKNTSFGSIDEL